MMTYNYRFLCTVQRLSSRLQFRTFYTSKTVIPVMFLMSGPEKRYGGLIVVYEKSSCFQTCVSHVKHLTFHLTQLPFMNWATDHTETIVWNHELIPLFVLQYISDQIFIMTSASPFVACMERVQKRRQKAAEGRAGKKRPSELNNEWWLVNMRTKHIVIFIIMSALNYIYTTKNQKTNSKCAGDFTTYKRCQPWWMNK